MHQPTTWLLFALAACGGGSKTTEPATTATATMSASTSTVFELGEITLLEDGQPTLKLHPDGSTEMGYRSGKLDIQPGTPTSSKSLPIQFKSGPTIRTDGTFVHEGAEVARMNADGTFVSLKTGSPVAIPDLVVTAEQIRFTNTPRGRSIVTVTADGTLVPPSGTAEGFGTFRIEGADTPGKRRAVLAIFALSLLPGKAVETPICFEGETVDASGKLSPRRCNCQLALAGHNYVVECDAAGKQPCVCTTDGVQTKTLPAAPNNCERLRGRELDTMWSSCGFPTDEP